MIPVETHPQSGSHSLVRYSRVMKSADATVPRFASRLHWPTILLASLAVLPACAAAPYRTARIEDHARDRETGTVYFVEIRRGRQVLNGTGDELNTDDEVTAVIVCNDRTPEVCVRVLPDTLRTVEETRAWAERLNSTIDAQSAPE